MTSDMMRVARIPRSEQTLAAATSDMPTITLPDGSEKHFDTATRGAEIAAFANTLLAMAGKRRGRAMFRQLDIRNFVRRGHDIIDEGAGQ